MGAGMACNVTKCLLDDAVDVNRILGSKEAIGELGLQVYLDVGLP